MCHDVWVMFFLTPMAMPFLSNRAAKGLSQAAALSVLAASGLILAGPAQAAAVNPCNFDSTSTDSYKVRSSNPATVTLTSPGFACQLGDKIYSDFIFSNAFNGNFSFNVRDNGDYIFSGAGLTGVGNGFSYQYKVTLVDPRNGFSKWNTSFAGSSTNPAALSYTKTLTAVVGGTNVGVVTAQGNGVSVTSDGPGAFAPNEKGPVIFKNVVTRDSGSTSNFDTLTDSIVQYTPGPGVESPAPLPLLGAGAAFGMSRKLRRRIKLA